MVLGRSGRQARRCDAFSCGRRPLRAQPVRSASRATASLRALSPRSLPLLLPRLLSCRGRLCRQIWARPMARFRAASGLDLFSRGAAPTSASGQTEAAGPAIPEGFDKAGFEAVAKENFLKLQKAWDSGNVVEISDLHDRRLLYCRHAQAARTRQQPAQTSEVINLSVNLLGILTEGDENVAVVEFDGAMKVAGEFEQGARALGCSSRRPTTPPGGCLRASSRLRIPRPPRPKANRTLNQRPLPLSA